MASFMEYPSLHGPEVTVIKENQIQRRNRLDQEILTLLYKRMVLQKQLEDVEKQILSKDGAINENEALRRDINTEEAMKAGSTEDKK